MEILKICLENSDRNQIERNFFTITQRLTIVIQRTNKIDDKSNRKTPIPIKWSKYSEFWKWLTIS